MTTTSRPELKATLDDLYRHAALAEFHGQGGQEQGLRLREACERVAAWIARQVGTAVNMVELPDGYHLDHAIEGTDGVLVKDVGETYFVVGSPEDGWDDAAAAEFAGDILSGWIGRLANKLNHRADEYRQLAERVMVISRSVRPEPPPRLEDHTDGGGL